MKPQKLDVSGNLRLFNNHPNLKLKIESPKFPILHDESRHTPLSLPLPLPLLFPSPFLLLYMASYSYAL